MANITRLRSRRAAGRQSRRRHADADAGRGQKSRAGKPDAAGHFAHQGKPGNAGRKSAAARRATGISAAQAVPVLAFLAAFVWRKRTDNLANNPRLRRQRAVAAARPRAA